MSTWIQSVIDEIAPNGILDFAINFGNPILAQNVNGVPAGVSVALAKALAAELGVEYRLHTFDAAGKVFAANDEGVWGIAFLANEPVRADKLSFSEPYVTLEGTYLVRENSPYQTVQDLDKQGNIISVGRGAAYDLYLSRTLEYANLERVDTSARAVDVFLSDKGGLTAAAGIRSYLIEVCQNTTGFRVIKDSFTQIHQAIATQKNKPNTAWYLNDFVARKKQDGFITQALIDNHQSPLLLAK